MAWTFDSALSDDLITVVERNDHAGYFEFRVGELETVITVELRRFLNSEEIEFRPSHAIKTPTQAGPYQTSKNFEDEPAYALQRAISGITDWYRGAVRSGHIPNEEWLVSLPR